MSNVASQSLEIVKATEIVEKGYYTSNEMFNYVWPLKHNTLFDSSYEPHLPRSTEHQSGEFEDLRGNRWLLKLSWDCNQQNLSISMISLKVMKLDALIMFSISAFTEGSGQLKTFKTETPVDFVKEKISTRPNFLSRLDLSPQNSRPSLYILCRLDTVDLIINDLITNSLNAFESSVADDLGDLFNSGNHYDVFVVSGEELKCHKAILSTRSKVFAAMFEHKMTENKENRVIIDDFKKDVIEEMLRFIYTGRSTNINVLAAELLPAADKYELQQLKRICTLALIKNTNVETAAEFLVLADRYKASSLKAHVVKFINMNPVRVTQTEGWQNLHSSAHAHLIFDIYKGLAPILENLLKK